MALAAFAAQPRFVVARSGSDYRFAVVHDFRALEAMEVEWNDLADRAADARMGFQSFAWLHSWAVRYAESSPRLHIVLGYHKGRLALIWPLGVRTWFGLKILHYIGEPMAQYHDAIIDPAAPGEALIAAAIDALSAAGFDVLWLRRVREDSPLTPALRAAGARLARSLRSPYVDLARHTEAHLSSKARQNRRRRLRRLAEIGEIDCDVARTPEQARAWIAQALVFKREWARMSGCHSPSVFDPRFEACFGDAASARVASLRVFAMLCAGRPIGIDISFAYRGRLFAHVLAHDPALAKFGVGAALADASIQAAKAQGYEVFDLLAPADAYKCDWSHGEIGVNDFWLAPTRRGAIYAVARSWALEKLRAAAKRAPPFLFRALMARAERQRLDSVAPPR